MMNRALEYVVLLVALLGLTACISQREHVLAPTASGIVIDAGSHQPVEGAEVRYAGVEGAAPVMTGADGRFTLEGRTEMRTIMTLPVGGMFRDATLVRASVPGAGAGFSSAEFINGGQPAQALHEVIVLVFPQDTEAPPLRALMQDCIDKPEQDHAVRLVDHVSRMSLDERPDWLDPDAAIGLYEYVRLALPSSLFLACEHTSQAFEMFREQTETLREFGQYAAARESP